LAGLAGATVAALNTYQKNFLKNKKNNLPNKSNCAKMSTSPTTHLNHENEASDSGHQRARVDSLRH
jgi:hypothetical protein